MGIGRCNTDRDRLRANAHKLVTLAIKSGQLAPPKDLACADCGDFAWCYDHRDYRKPMVIDPVCQACNNRRGPGLPLPTIADNAEYKLSKTTGKSQGERWGDVEGGEGYEPLSARLLIDAPDAMNQNDINNSFWNGSRFADRGPEFREKTWKARADWFKARDPWYA